jgi:glycosyltransferase involved in cell wall biosynthesis
MYAFEATSGLSRTDREQVLFAKRRVCVLFVNDTARNGGPGRSLHSILKFLDPAVVRRVVVLPREDAIADLLSTDGVADELLFVRDLVENPVEPWSRPMQRRDFAAPPPLKAVRFAGNVVRAARALAVLSAIVRRERADLVYCNGTNADFISGAVTAITRVPAIWHVRYSSLPSGVDRLHRALSARDRVRRVVCVSRAAAGLFSHCPDKVTIIPNGVDAVELDPNNVAPQLRAELGIGADVVVFGSHGRVLRRKGYVEMLRAARLALDRMSPSERRLVAFVVVGDTPEDFRPDHVGECRALAADLRIEQHVHWLGFRSQIGPLVADFDVAVVPSVYADPLPRAVIESMALGKPVVGFDVGGVAEMIDPGVTGELVPFEPAGGQAGPSASQRAVERLADAFVRYARDADLRRKQGRAARDRALREFDARLHARRIQNEIVAASGLCSEPDR